MIHGGLSEVEFVGVGGREEQLCGNVEEQREINQQRRDKWTTSTRNGSSRSGIPVLGSRDARGKSTPTTGDSLSADFFARRIGPRAN
jgi:hypothetical protein